MRMEFTRMTGAFISQRPWPFEGKSVAELTAQAKEALASFYDGDGYSFWPKKEYALNVPEQVCIVESSGAIVVQYDLTDFLAETGSSLIGGNGL